MPLNRRFFQPSILCHYPESKPQWYGGYDGENQEEIIMPQCILGNHCEIVTNASSVIKRVRELCSLRDMGMPAEPIVEAIRNVVECDRHKAAIEEVKMI